MISTHRHKTIEAERVGVLGRVLHVEEANHLHGLARERLELELFGALSGLVRCRLWLRLKLIERHFLLLAPLLVRNDRLQQPLAPGTAWRERVFQFLLPLFSYKKWSVECN